MKTIRVLFLATGWRGHGGVNTFNRGLATAIAGRSDVEAYLALPEQPSERDRKEIKLTGLTLLVPDPASWMVPDATARLLCRLKPNATELNIEVIVGHGRWTGPAAHELGRRLGAKVVYFVHVDPAIEFEKDREGTQGSQYDSKMASDSDLCKRAWLRFGVGPRLSQVFPNTRDLLPGLSLGQSTNTKAKRALLIGRMEDPILKGLGIAVHAMCRAADELSEKLTLEIRGGSGPVSEADRIVRGHETSRVKVQPTDFTTDESNLQHSYHRSAIVLMTSAREGFGLVAMEALEHSRAVVATSESGFAQVLEEVLSKQDYERFVYEGASESSMNDTQREQLIGEVASRIEFFMSNPNERKTLVDKARAAMANRCSWETTARDFVDAIQERLEGHGGDERSGDDEDDGVSTDSTDSEVVGRDGQSGSPKVEPPNLTQASEGLRSWPRDIANQWIPRQEQTQLLAHSTETDTHGPLLLLGPPGSGKSALLGWLDDKLRDDGWSVLSIKADLLSSEVARWTPAKLGEELGLGMLDPLETLCSQEGPHALIVDQLDAVAATVDTRTGRLSILLSIVRRAVRRGVKVFVSTRKMEADYDPRLRMLTKDRGSEKAETVSLLGLEAARVVALWNSLGHASIEKAPAHIQWPQGLKMAHAIGDVGSDERDVLGRYWQAQVATAESERIDELTSFTDHLERMESLWGSYTGDAAYWVERGVLNRSPMDERYGFGHQQLREYALARKWVDKHSEGGLAEHLEKWISSRLDSLNFRPRLVAILSQCREDDAAAYLKAHKKLWQLGNERLHLRQLLANHLGRTTAPTPGELRQMKHIFSEAAPGVRWAALTSIAGNEEWFRGLQAWIERRLGGERGTELVFLLSSAWTFAAPTIEKWIGRFWLRTEQAAALRCLSQRKEWSKEGEALILRFARSPQDRSDFEFLMHMIAGHPDMAARVRAEYISHQWRVAERRFDVEPSNGILETAKNAPDTFVCSLMPAFMEQVGLDESWTKRERFHDSGGNRQYRSEFESRYRVDEPLLALEAALRLLSKKPDVFAEHIRTLLKSDKELVRTMALRAHWDAPVEVIVEFYINDPGHLGLVPTAKLLSSRAKSFSSTQQELLLKLIAEHERDAVTDGMDDDRRRRLMNRNDRYRVALRDIVLGQESADALSAMNDVAIRSGTTHSPVSRSELNEMTGAERETLAEQHIDGYHDKALDEWTGRGWVGGTTKLAGTFAEWAKENGGDAWALCQHLRDLETVDAPRYLALIGSLLRGCAQAEPAVGLDRIGQVLRDGYGLASDESHSDFWYEVIQAVRATASSELVNHEVLGKLGRWIKTGRVVDCEDTRKAKDRGSAFPRGGLIQTSRVVSALQTVASALGEDHWPELLGFYRSVLTDVSPLEWAKFFTLAPHHPKSDGLEDWKKWIAELFEAHPSMLNSPFGVSVLWRENWRTEPQQFRKWLATLKDKWPTAAAELTALSICSERHRDWAKVSVEDLLTNESEVVLNGLACGLATGWSDDGVRPHVHEFAMTLINQAPPEIVSVFLRELDTSAFRPNSRFFDLCKVLLEREIEWPEYSARRVGTVLLEGVEDEPLLSARMGKRLAGMEKLGNANDLLTLAFRLQRWDDDDELRLAGIELFEQLLRSSSHYANQFLQTLG